MRGVLSAFSGSAHGGPHGAAAAGRCPDSLELCDGRLSGPFSGVICLFPLGWGVFGPDAGRNSPVSLHSRSADAAGWSDVIAAVG